MKYALAIALMFVTAGLCAESGATATVVPIQNLGSQREVQRYGVLRTNAANILVIESLSADGVLEFHSLHHVDGKFTARVASSGVLPGRLREPGVAASRSQRFAGIGTADQYWDVAGDSPFVHDQYVTAVPLPARRFADVSGSTVPETPPDDSGLAVDFVTADVSGAVLSTCRLESNLLRRRERMTVAGARWVFAQGRAHLLVGMAVDAGDEPWPLFYRLYSPDLELVAQTPVILLIDPNRFPDPVFADLTGDGEDEVIVISSHAVDAPLAILDLGPASVNRVLSLNGCEVRMNGPDVVQAQRSLAARGYSLGRYGVDGWYGPFTRAAVVRFQRDNGLLVSGVVDDQTWAALSR